jgi:hypothetical protein
MERQWTAAAYRAFPGKVESGFVSGNAGGKDQHFQEKHTPSREVAAGSVSPMAERL